MARVIIPAARSTVPSKAEYKALLGCLGHDLITEFATIRLGIDVLFESESNKAVQIYDQSLEGINEIIRIRNVLYGFSRKGEIEHFDLEKMIEPLKNVSSRDIGFMAHEKIECNNNPNITYLQLKHFVQNASNAYNGEEGKIGILTYIGEIGQGLFRRGMKPFRNLYQASDQFVCVTVKDLGEGIPERDLKKIFKLGYTTTEGSGIGLGLTRRLCRGVHGFVTAESVEGKGSEFSLYFPVNRRKDP
jgi:signal transduction histidine kinase